MPTLLGHIEKYNILKVEFDDKTTTLYPDPPTQDQLKIDLVSLPMSFIEDLVFKGKVIMKSRDYHTRFYY